VLVLSEAVLVLVFVLVIEAIRASAIHLSITSTSTVRQGGLSTSTTKSQNESCTEVPIRRHLKWCLFQVSTSRCL
jgi:hypothetical protein